MPSDPESDDPLLRAIDELRADVNHLIDEQVTYVKDRVEDLTPPRPLRTAPVLNAAEPAPVEVPKARSLDPRQRLDALAKHLDHRLRLANVPAPERAERPASPEE
jgi:hypothetical protein